MSKLLEADELLVEAQNFARLLSMACTDLPDERDQAAMDQGVMRVLNNIRASIDIVGEVLNEKRAAELSE